MVILDVLSIIGGIWAVVHLWGWPLIAGIAASSAGYKIEIGTFILKQRRVLTPKTKDDHTMEVGIRVARIIFAIVVIIVSYSLDVSFLDLASVLLMYVIGSFHARGVLEYRRWRWGTFNYLTGYLGITLPPPSNQAPPLDHAIANDSHVVYLRAVEARRRGWDKAEP